MEVTVNENTGGDATRKVFTGVFNMHVKALNPNKEELEAMGRKPKNDPDYFIRNKDNSELIEGVRLSFYLENKYKDDTISCVLNLYLRKNFIESKKDPSNPTFQHIDRFGKSCFVSSIDVETNSVSYTWIDGKSLKKAVSGQVELVEFIRSLCNNRQDEAMSFDSEDLRKFFSGNVVELRKILKMAEAKDGAVRVLLGTQEKDGKFYQTVFERKFDFPWGNTSKYIHKTYMQNFAYIKEGVFFGDINEQFNESNFNIKEFDPEKSGLENNSTGSTSSQTQQTPDLINGGSEEVAFPLVDDDLPF